jgi:hypothetical protein
MANDKQIQISAALLEELTLCLMALIDRSKGDDQDVRDLNARANRAVSSAATILRGSIGPQSFSGSETGQFRVDPTQSQFL